MFSVFFFDRGNDFYFVIHNNSRKRKRFSKTTAWMSSASFFIKRVLFAGFCFKTSFGFGFCMGTQIGQ